MKKTLLTIAFMTGLITLGMVKTHVREVTIDGVPFLFYGCERICNLTGLGTPTITADPITPTLLTISFGGGAPSIQYDTKKGKLP